MNRPAWPVICARCGEMLTINSIVIHCKNRHDWKNKNDGDINPTSNPFWRNKRMTQ